MNKKIIEFIIILIVMVFIIGCENPENPHLYTVIYNGNTNTDGTVPIDPNVYASGQTVTVMGNTGNLVKSEYSFTGWNTQEDGEGITFTEGNTFIMGYENEVLYAKWTQNPTYIVLYNGNSNTGGTVPIDSNQYFLGQIVTVLGNTGNLVKSGFYFNSWNTSEDGNGITYTPGQTFTMNTEGCTLYAQWIGNPGSLDTSFETNPGENNGLIQVIAVQNDGKILIGGGFTSYNGTIRNHIARLNTDGSIDTSFNPGTGANNHVLSIAIQEDGKILIGGTFTEYNGTPQNCITRLNTDGSLDTSFNSGTGIIGGVSPILATCVGVITLQADNKILIGGVFTEYNGTPQNYITRLNTDGYLDISFNSGTGITGAIIDSRFTDVRAITIQNDNKILIGGMFTEYNGISQNCITRINPDGSLDTFFNETGTGTNSTVNTIAQQPDGQILIAGGFTSYNGITRSCLAKLNIDGTLDSYFNFGSGANNYIFTLSLQSDGKILIAGAFSSYNDIPRNHIARINPDSSLDNTFNPGSGANNNVYNIAFESKNKIMIVGTFSAYNDVFRRSIARIWF